VNKVVKYRYLFPKHLPDGEALQKAVGSAIVDYNDHRPHGSLEGLTPSEAYQGIGKKAMRVHQKLKTAQRARIAASRTRRGTKSNQ
jgi:putative transposase